MLFVWTGFLKRGMEIIPASVEVESIDFLGQPLINIRAAGQLRDKSGKRVGMMIVFERDNFEEARAFVKDSPFLVADLYEDHQLFEFVDEIG